MIACTLTEVRYQHSVHIGKGCERNITPFSPLHIMFKVWEWRIVLLPNLSYLESFSFLLAKYFGSVAWIPWGFDQCEHLYQKTTIFSRDISETVIRISTVKAFLVYSTIIALILVMTETCYLSELLVPLTCLEMGMQIQLFSKIIQTGELKTQDIYFLEILAILCILEYMTVINIY